MSPDDSRIDRRRALRLLVGAALAPAVALPPRGAAAWRRWCRADPIFSLGEKAKLDLWVGVEAQNFKQARARVKGPVLVRLHVAPGTEVDRLDHNPGFGDGFAWEAIPDEALGQGEVYVEVSVPWSGAPTKVEVTAELRTPRPQGEKVGTGTTDGWVGVAL